MRWRLGTTGSAHLPGSARVRAAVIVVVTVISACGGDDDDRSTAERIREAVEEGNAPNDVTTAGPEDGTPVCELVTEQDAEGLFGAGAQQADDTSAVGTGEACIWENVDASEPGRVGHLLQVRVYDGPQFYNSELFEDSRPVDGLGDRAFVSTGVSTAAGVTVQFVEDDKTFAITYTTINIAVEPESDKVEASDHADEVIALARQAAERM
jgi:hypothetical protein